MSLLEVLVALAIFLFALVALGRLIIIGGERARDVEELAQATRLCQSKLAEIAAGAVPLSSQSGAPFDETSDWTWSLDCSTDDIPNLWNVTVKVGKNRADGSRIECTLVQKLLDPSQRGNAVDGSLAAPQSSNSANSTASAAPSSGSAPSNGAGSGAAATAPNSSNQGPGRSSGGSMASPAGKATSPKATPKQ
jgi:type II secretory pathway pseudopilin PulG